MSLQVLDGERLRSILPMAAAIDALDAAFGADRLPEAPQRTHLDLGGADLLIMPASGAPGAGVKVVTVNPSNPSRGLPLINGAYVLFEPGSFAVAGMIEGSALTELRTAAVSGLATRYLARAQAARLVIFGAGVQANAHLEAMRAVRPIGEVTVVSRTPARAEALAERAGAAGLSATTAGPDAVGGADIVCTCTTSAEPVFPGALLRSGAHVNAVGAYTPAAREVDDETIRTARLIVELRAAATREAGDLVIPLRNGVIEESDITELSDVVSGAPVRRGDGDITLFKSVGVAFEDLIVARAAFDRLPHADRRPDAE